MMPVTAMGKKWARKVHDNTYSWPDDVPVERRQDCYDSYVALRFEPPIDPPTPAE